MMTRALKRPNLLVRRVVLREEWGSYEFSATGRLNKPASIESTSELGAKKRRRKKKITEKRKRTDQTLLRP